MSAYLYNIPQEIRPYLDPKVPAVCYPRGDKLMVRCCRNKAVPLKVRTRLTEKGYYFGHSSIFFYRNNKSCTK